MPPADWMDMLESVSRDAEVPLPEPSELSAVYSRQIGSEADYTLRGPYYRLTAWFSIIPAIRHKVQFSVVGWTAAGWVCDFEGIGKVKLKSYGGFVCGLGSSRVLPLNAKSREPRINAFTLGVCGFDGWPSVCAHQLIWFKFVAFISRRHVRSFTRMRITFEPKF